ncbi:MAG: hypothetical protein PQ612_00315 [Rickettsiales bacterium]|nr:hypothetical protein [Pseudomonadota bacterium]MDA0965642.1 hypothetical protein [Pseudomonadota bacterium]MDG4542966.1 hypothetical protein [Rickettsiales bacterium]MDG4544586.1 hypothetical protein [Rickettsiales bacterium]MDG4546708.1 hypothetical protein [Rickettsiales bacterium]
MKTSALILPALLVGSKAFLDPAFVQQYRSGLKNRNTYYNDKPHLGKNIDGKHDTKLEMFRLLKGLWGFLNGDNEKGIYFEADKQEDKFNTEALKPKEKFNTSNVRYLLGNDLLGGVLKVTKKGLNPDMVLDDEGNNTAHLIAKGIVRKFSENEDNAKIYVDYGMEIIKQLTVSGIDLGSKNKDGETVEDIFNNSSNLPEQKDENRYIYKQLAFLVQSYRKNQMNPMAEISDQKDEDIVHVMFDDPTSQLFNIAEQLNPSSIAIDRVSALIKTGADIYATRHRTNMNIKDKTEQDKYNDRCVIDDIVATGVKKDNDYYNKALIETAKENWGEQASDKLITMVKVRDIVAKSSSYHKFEEKKSPDNCNEGLTVSKLFSWDIAEKDFKKIISEHQSRQP